MDVFALRDQVISEYRSYSEGFVEIADERIREAVDDAFDKGLLWPSPRIASTAPSADFGRPDASPDSTALAAASASAGSDLWPRRARRLGRITSTTPTPSRARKRARPAP